MSPTCNSISADRMTWQPHPRFRGVEIAYLVTREKDDVDVTFALVRLPVGSQPDKHVHEHSDDIVFVLQGKATMWIDGVGDVALTKGCFLRVPQGVQHQPRNIEEDVLLYNVWLPALT
ncbi:cupin domain-containing protein [Rhodoplanes sp. TEM]|uniref:Cupin domain-containing protein n=1 Tax=Rhodoplanes tepidamans TaxID=200616 RepID=A0ABT5JAM5_RHOTP|nr:MULTISPECIES: cupin domain-containing protein [Rhodoplanes]MDC7786642.1 cupin domain-containing protein [Rhodoplanes tepidamans]MDC7983011.1 cupin domain-containing protein [Rhodoplanes sp. TEM]MDQ0356393.1 mannose-6-phosphate isomerase-like protein (cupin superfamily) [Rhodoplanes tepidamans]